MDLVNTDVLKQLIKEAVRELIDEGSLSRKLNDTERIIAEINCKPFITVPEAALLLSCSDSHLYNQIKKVMKGHEVKYPIPFQDLNGIYVFPREELLKWAAVRKHPKAKEKASKK